MKGTAFFLIAVTILFLPMSRPVSSQPLVLNESQSGESGLEAEIVRVPYVTVRKSTGDSNPVFLFGGSRGQMTAGVCDVSISPIPGLDEIAKAAPFYFPGEKMTVSAIHRSGVEDFYDEVVDLTEGENKRVVIYVHGYNIDFEQGCRRSAIFQKELGPDDHVVLFSWPSDGDMLKYTWDESDLVWSVPYMAEFLNGMIGRAGKGRINVVAHSLGARGVVRALIRLVERNFDKTLIRELVLIAPDIDTDVFKQEFPRFRDSVGRITLYISENDRALKLSHEAHGYPRLGQAGSYLTILPGMETIDISDLGLRRASGHLYHLFNPEVISDLTRLLRTGEAAGLRPSLEKASRKGQTYWRMAPAGE